MKILNEQPPFIDQVKKVFKLSEGTVFTYKDIIYNPSGALIDEHLMKHEELHSAQQGNNPMEWWKRYLKDPAFRVSQEMPAYRIQYQSAKKVIRDRNKLNAYLIQLAKDLSGEIYANLMTFQEALDVIKTK